MQANVSEPYRDGKLPHKLSSNTINRRGVGMRARVIANRNISATQSNGTSIDHVVSEPYNTLSENISPVNALRMMTLNQKSTMEENSLAAAGLDDVCNLPMTDF